MTTSPEIEADYIVHPGGVIVRYWGTDGSDADEMDAYAIAFADVEGGWNAASKVLEGTFLVESTLDGDGSQEFYHWKIPGTVHVSESNDPSRVHEAIRCIDDGEEWEYVECGEEGEERICAIFFPDIRRCGVFMRGEATWTDASSIKEGIGRVAIGEILG